MKECIAECKQNGDDPDPNGCCVFACDMGKLGVLKKVTNADNSSSIEVESQGFVTSFMMSIGNDSAWTKIVHDSVERCYNQLIFFDQLGCNGRIPLAIYDIIDCAYLENFLRCPKYNPYEIKECEDTYKYVDDCFDHGDSLE